MTSGKNDLQKEKFKREPLVPGNCPSACGRTKERLYLCRSNNSPRSEITSYRGWEVSKRRGPTRRKRTAQPRILAPLGKGQGDGVVAVKKSLLRNTQKGISQMEEKSGRGKIGHQKLVVGTSSGRIRNKLVTVGGSLRLLAL